MAEASRTSRNSQVLGFADFKIDLRGGSLYRNGTTIRLQEQPFQVLALLTKHAGEVVTREQLRLHLWPANTFVDFDNSLNAAINKVREALGDSANDPIFIETLSRRGYRFIAPVQEVPSSASPIRVQRAASKIPTTGTLTRGRRWVPILLVGIALGITGYGARQHFARRLTDKDTIVLADFDNSTGDSVFDDTLKQALAVQLQQSPFLSLVPDQQVRETMQFMERSPNEHVSGTVAQEVCERQGGKAVLQGAIKSLGPHYVLSLNALNCETGASLAREQAEVEGKELILAALGGMASRLRRKLGESLALVEKYDTPVAEATTSSLDALRAYSLGVNEIEKGNPAGAVPFLKRAIELDRNFALGYMGLYIADWDIGEYELGREAAAKAFALRERVSERETLYITALYHDIVTGDLQKVIEADELWAKMYPRESIPHDSLAIDHSLIGSYDIALAESYAAIRVAPQSSSGYGNLALAQQGLNHWTESRAALEQLITIGAESHAYIRLFTVAFAQGDQSAMQKCLEIGARKVRENDMPTFQFNQATVAAFQGQLRKARELVNTAVRSADRVGLKQNQPAMLAQEARWEAQLGNFQRAEERARFAIKQAHGIDVELNSALALALAGHTKIAHSLADDLERTYPEDTILKAVSVPLIRSTISLQQGNPQKALELLKISEQYELGIGMYYFPALMPTYVRGQAYLKLRDGPKAARQFQKVLDHRGSGPTSLNYVLAQLELGRANALAGDTAGAKAAYGAFLTLWKDADPDIPIFKQAKAEYAKLQ
jgi:DNA-binding winged helix-turn-helix (wHTH) protein/tetratricopeptide (TPR) repeat protein